MFSNEEFEVTLVSEAFTFSCAHFIAYEGYREKLHGHNYTIEATVYGSLNQDGYVVDFSDIKKIIREACQVCTTAFRGPFSV